MSLHTLPILLPLLEKPESGKLEFVITELYQKSNSLSSSEQEHVCSRVINLLRNYNLYNNFFALKVINVLVLNNSILANQGSKFFSNIVKVISNVNSFNDGNKLNQIVLNAAIQCIKTILQETRGKPGLTRDIVTPNLPGFVGSVIESIDIDPFPSIEILYQLIQTNTVTFRPFGAKFERKLLSLLKNFNSMSQDLREVTCQSYVLCKFILTQKNNEESYQKFNHELLLEIKSVLKIYDNFVDVENSDDFLGKVNKFNGEEVAIFEPLKIDSNSPETIFQINDRVSILIELLICVFKVNRSFKIPLGNVIIITELLLSFNTNFIQLKREFRLLQLKNILNQSISKIQECGVHLLSCVLEEFRGELIPHFTSLLSNLEYSVPVTKLGTLDKEAILSNEGFICELIQDATELLSLTHNYTDYPMLTKLIEASFILTKPRSVSIDDTPKQDKNKKKKKSNGSSGMSDLLSHGELFIKDEPDFTKSILNKFYEVLSYHVVLPATKKTQIAKYALSSLLISRKNPSDSLIELLKAILLNASSDSVNILPFICEILGNDDELISLFINPRLPPLPQIIRAVEKEEELEEEEEEQEEMVEEKEVKGEKEIRQEEREDEKPQVKRIKLDDEKPKLRVLDSKYADKTFQKVEEPVKELTEHIEVIEKKIEVEIPVSIKDDSIEEDLDNDDGDESDIEIPDIDLSSDDED